MEVSAYLNAAAALLHDKQPPPLQYKLNRKLVGPRSQGSQFGVHKDTAAATVSARHVRANTIHSPKTC